MKIAILGAGVTETGRREKLGVAVIKDDFRTLLVLERSINHL